MNNKPKYKPGDCVRTDLEILTIGDSFRDSKGQLFYHVYFFPKTVLNSNDIPCDEFELIFTEGPISDKEKALFLLK